MNEKIKQRSCCLIVYQSVPMYKKEYIKTEIKREVNKAIINGYSYFLSSFSDNIDIYFASIIAKLKGDAQIHLEAVIPYRNRLRQLLACEETREFISLCNVVGIHNEMSQPNSATICNNFMMKNANRVIIVYNRNDKGDAILDLCLSHDYKEISLIPI